MLTLVVLLGCLRLREFVVPGKLVATIECFEIGPIGWAVLGRWHHANISVIGVTLIALDAGRNEWIDQDDNT